MKRKLWIQICITVGIVLTSAVVGMMCGLSFDHINLFGEMGYQINLLELTGNVFAIASAAGCLLYFSHSDS